MRPAIAAPAAARTRAADSSATSSAPGSSGSVAESSVERSIPGTGSRPTTPAGGSRSGITLRISRRDMIE